MESFGVLKLVFTMASLALVPFLFVMITCFTKIVIVLFILRNAMGVQQAPPNLVIYGITFLLTVFIWMPVGQQIAERIEQQGPSLESMEGWKTALEQATPPVKDFIRQYVNQDEHRFFAQSAAKLWKLDAETAQIDDHILVLVPAFVISELSAAFEIGFMLYLPFLIIDLVVSNILLAMGSMMVSPVMIALPVKLFMFVSVDGWSRLMQGVIESYAI